MPVSIRTGGVVQPISRLSVQISGSLKPLRKLSVRTGGTLKLIYNAASALTLDIEPNPAEAHPPRGSGTAGISVTATPSGGVGPYSYSWRTVSFVGAIPGIVAASFASTLITQSGLVQFDDNPCTFACDVTDSTGATATASVAATFLGPIDSGGTF